ncbi:hypothetical protein GCM10008090_08450 [Arenicella chitinivorans]|uniref:Nucleoside phosphorylase domain-containing protein n=2 Tax=Arenicella chitinivorans TaxID=1329800 RepID=A0A918RJV2_9GAMM|nr:hypothetical protein GCM10008090_08450 [Arenicella chitinivorans]
MLFALSCEARPWIDALKLNKVPVRPYDLYTKDNIEVVITGIGSESMATAIGWVAGRNPGPRVWLNVGTAGHATRELGELLLVHGCAASEKGRAHYPPLVAAWDGATDAVLCVDHVSDHYPGGAAVDMESMAFFNAALRFSDSELVQSIKVVSDNERTGVEHLNPKRITELMQPHVTAVMHFAYNLLSLMPNAFSVPQVLHIESLRASHSVKQQIQRALHQLTVLGMASDCISEAVREQASARDVLTALQKMVDDRVPTLEVADG